MVQGYASNLSKRDITRIKNKYGEQALKCASQNCGKEFKEGELVVGVPKEGKSREYYCIQCFAKLRLK